MATTTTQREHSRENPPDLHHVNTWQLEKEGRKWGLILGAITAVYLLIVNAIFADLPLGLRFAKHLIIIPVLWIATSKYAASVPEGEAFKGEISLMFRIGAWATAVLATTNIILSAINPDIGFEQFMNEGNTFGDAMMNSFFIAMETLVFVMIIGFVFLQYYKGKGSPED